MSTDTGEAEVRSVLEARIEAVRGLHQPEPFFDAPDEMFCAHCQRTAGVYPCPTIRALDGEPS